MAEENRINDLLARMAESAELFNGLIAKAKGRAPSAPVKRVSASNENRLYRVSDWRATCKGCGRDGQCGEDKYECGNARWFPIVHNVSVTVRNGVVETSTCREGRVAGGPLCSDAKCNHVKRVMEAMGGGSDKGVELVMVAGAQEATPKCPNCRERWAVTPMTDGRFECRSPVCQRDGESWVFEEGSTKRPPPMRHGLVIKDRDPGRVVRKTETSKRWGR